MAVSTRVAAENCPQTTQITISNGAVPLFAERLMLFACELQGTRALSNPYLYPRTLRITFLTIKLQPNRCEARGNCL